ncbi:MAG: dUTP diphosphatase [Candidatus Diapherotrites archaeon]|nr:dUTP diphosphatase [Candidatus Diapherotrites archaeon]
MKLKIMKIHSDAVIPKYAHEGDAGMDLYSVEETVLNPNETKLIATGIKLAIPIGFEVQVRPKSGLAANHGITVLNTPGTIDAGYRGEVKVILINHSGKEFRIEKGSKIAQMVLKKVEFAEIEEVTELDETKRSENGFGSTGLK